MINMGLIGLSEGNGHPYSWGALINGYDENSIKMCGYPAIPQYLAEQPWPESCISGAKITHVWTQSKALSHAIAEATYIENIVNNIEDMIDTIDAVLLARDDAKNHYAMALPFLENGIPIYIDKPICLSLDDLKKIYDKQQYDGQIFSCSALRYSSDFKLTAEDKNRLGKIVNIEAVVPKDWARYAVHIIEPLLLIIGEQGKLLSSKKVLTHNNTCTTYYRWESDLHVSITSLNRPQGLIGMRIIGENDRADLYFLNTFSAFKKALEHFKYGIEKRTVETPYKFIEKVVDMIERGL